MRKIAVMLFVLCFIGSSVSGTWGATIFESFWRDKEQGPGKLESVILGAGAYYATSPYVDIDEDVSPFPIIIAEYERFYIDGRKVGLLLADDGESLKFSAILAARLQGYDADDSPFLAGMNNRYASVDGGLRLEWENDLCLLNLSFETDLFNNHQGQELTAVISREFFGGFLTPRLGLSWQSEDLIDYYYGVSESEATTARRFYSGESTVNYLMGLRIGYPLGDNWAVIGDVGCALYGDEIQESPIVDADAQFTWLLGAVYRF